MKLYYKLVGSKFRRNYWSCSKFADFIRKIFNVTPKPTSATMEGWDVWHAKNKSNVGYWVAEEGLDLIQDIFMFVPDVYHNARVYVKNRFIDKPHYLNTKLKKGDWYEMDTRILNGLFETLVDFVEIEKAHLQYVSEELRGCVDDEKRLIKRWKNPFVRSPVPSRELGLRYLDWEIGLGDESPRQSEVAKEIKELYLWWKDARPSYQDVHDISGWSEWCKKRYESGECWWGEKTDEEREQVRKILELNAELEQARHDEETEMLIRLIKIRKGLWT